MELVIKTLPNGVFHCRNARAIFIRAQSGRDTRDVVAVIEPAIWQ